MITFTHQEGNRNLVIFVHGLMGGMDTWRNGDINFYDLLKKHPEIPKNCDIACHEYYTSLFNTPGRAKKLVSTIFGKKNAKQKNISISELARNFEDEIRFYCESYEYIVVIAHSMGGIITKRTILNDLQKSNDTKVKLFISLAVPHKGAVSANIGSLVSKNAHLKDLGTLSDIITSVNEEWIRNKQTPVSKYVYGTYDDVVEKNSSYPLENKKQDIISCQEDHSSICKPESEAVHIYLIVSRLITEFLQGVRLEEELLKDHPGDEKLYENELFVTKLLVADIHTDTIRHAKENFFKAEIVRKHYDTDSEMRKLKDLYIKVRELYKDSYTKYLSGSLDSMGLVADIHEKIISQDQHYLDTILPLVNGLHKKGMLHQLANDITKDIWWSENRDMEKSSIENE